jgi:hypothetical protein
VKEAACEFQHGGAKAEGDGIGRDFHGYQVHLGSPCGPDAEARRWPLVAPDAGTIAMKAAGRIGASTAVDGFHTMRPRPADHCPPKLGSTVTVATP